MEFLGINLTKYIQDLYAENYKTLIQEIQENLKIWVVIHDHGMENSILMKISILPT